MSKSIGTLLFICLFATLQAQVGVTTYSAETEDQYTLFSQLFGKNSYLIDNCGRLVNEWNPDKNNGLSAELLPNGNLVRGVRDGSSMINQPSVGGAIEIRSWDNEQLWYFEEYGATYIQHHDFSVLPNGNIMFLGWEVINPEEQLALGRDSANIVNPHMWGEYIKEVKQVGTEAEVVWEWHLKDHFIQDFDSSLENFAEISSASHNIDINFTHELQFDAVDPYHANALDLDPIRDEVVINLRSIGEFWILDHSTTTEEATTNAGGTAGKGGSILYRWGNPATYQQAESDDDWKLFGAHGTNFVDPGLENEGKVIVFNNGTLRPTEEYSTVEMISPALDDNDSYFLDANGQFATEEHTILYGEDKSLFSAFISNAHVTKNGNTFINDGDNGRLLEIDSDKNILWEYIIPIAFGQPINQSASNNNFLCFKAHRYPSDYITNEKIDLAPGELIELNPTSDFCLLLANEEPESTPVIIQNYHSIDVNAIISSEQLHVYSIDGRSQPCPSIRVNSHTYIDISSLSFGMYVLSFQDTRDIVHTHKFFVK